MKKIVIAFVIGLMFAFTACSPSASDLKEKAVMDSLRIVDSCAMVAAREAFVVDSIAKFKADSLAADSVKKLTVKKVVVKKAK